VIARLKLKKLEKLGKLEEHSKLDRKLIEKNLHLPPHICIIFHSSHIAQTFQQIATNSPPKLQIHRPSNAWSLSVAQLVEQLFPGADLRLTSAANNARPMSQLHRSWRPSQQTEPIPDTFLHGWSADFLRAATLEVSSQFELES